jgi:Kdo2-lipid IVA lauroyltransferase/acyltransferase
LRALTRPVATLPLDSARGLGGFMGRVFYQLLGGRRAIAIDNIEQAVRSGGLAIKAQAEEIARRSFENLGKNFAEMLRAYHRRDKDILDRIVVVGSENYDLARSRNRGIIVITGHCGNWEMLAVGLTVRFCPFSFLVQKIHGSLLNQFVEDARTRHGSQVIYPQGAVRAMLRKLRRKEMVGILIDQAMLDSEGCLIRFLGRPAVSTKLPALLARKTGASLLPCFCHRDDEGGFTVTVLPEYQLSRTPDFETAVTEDMQHLAGYIESFIRQHPDQWLWGHRRWKNVTELFPEMRHSTGKSLPG